MSTPPLVISSEIALGIPLFPATDALPVICVIDVDVPRCVRTYGVAPCTAAVGVTGDKKCFNTIRTCQDRENFLSETLTLRFTKPSARTFPDTIPSAQSVKVTPAQLDPGRSLGQRESVTVRFEDHPHSDVGLDPYVSERDYNPFEQGTFWGKFRARYPALRGQKLRIYRGEFTEDIAELERWHYIIETANLDGQIYTIVAKDALKMLDGDRAQAPVQSRGELFADITSVDASLTLTPSGIGDIDYPASGKGSIGGKEIVEFTRVGDVVTLVTRGIHNTVAVDHDEGDRFQLCLEYDAETVSDIIYDLMTVYAEVDPDWVDLDTWNEEVDTFIGHLYSTLIAEPTSVRSLVDELIEQAGLVVWWEPQEEQIFLTALRPVSSDARTYDEQLIVEGTFRAKEQPKERVSQAWTYFNLVNPLEDIDDPTNYTSCVVSLDPDAEEDYNGPAIKKTFSRWIAFGNRGAASRYNALVLSRYRDPPRLFSFDLYRDTELPPLGRGRNLQYRSLQDDTGARVTIPIQVVSLERLDDRTRVDAQEMTFTSQDGLADEHLIVIDADSFNIDLRELHDSLYASVESYDSVLCIIETGVIIGSVEASQPSFDVGDWPDLVDITVVLRGTIQGAGGRGGEPGNIGSFNGLPGEDGGAAFFTRVPVSLDSSGTLSGGGGGGGGADNFVTFSGPGGGGGAGIVPGPGGGTLNKGQPGTETAGGAGAADSARTAGDGGPPGTAGNPALPDGGVGGGAGAAVDGDSFVTYTNPGTIIGPQIN